jgi:DNA end-binding protein Ku
MAGKAIWKGVIGFGGFQVPVKMHPAIKDERVRFHLLHKRDHVRLEQQMVCAYEKVPVASEEQARGFEIEDGKFVLVEPGELERLNPESSRLIEVHEFVTCGAIDPIFIERVYYLAPDLQAGRYAALAGAMSQMGVKGICTWIMRKRSYVGAIGTDGRILCVSVLRYADQVVPVKSLDLPSVRLSEKELAIGGELIEKLSAPFRPEKFVDEHERKLRALLAKKARGERVPILRPVHVKPTRSDKLVQALEASLKKAA